MNPFKPVRELLRQPGTPLAGLMRDAQRLRRLEALLAEFLDRPILDHVRVAAAEHRRLVLAVDNPVWGHRVRYLAPAILQHLRQRAGLDLDQAHIIVRPAEPAPAARSAVPPPTLSPAAAALLERVAQALDNPSLARVLRRIGARGAPRA